MKLIILAGGGGSRLFPLSRSEHPKQFLRLAGDYTLLQQTIKRFERIVRPEDVIVVTNERYLFHVRDNLREINAEKAAIICEPVGRNTAPAIALAMSFLKGQGTPEDEVVFVTPSDHLITTEKEFRALAKKAAELCHERGRIITLGVPATAPETGYGYIEAGEALNNTVCREVLGFREKPSAEKAAEYVAKGSYYWNAGMFLFDRQTFESELGKCAPEIKKLMDEGYETCLRDFNLMPDISIDYAVAEKSKRMGIIPMDGIEWSDIGSFDAIAAVLSDEDGNAAIGDTVLEDCRSTMVMGGHRLISAIGVEDMMIIDTPDVLLISKKGSSQSVKTVVNRLKVAERPEVENGLTVYRPWGSYTTLCEGDGYKVKKITVNPGQKLSLQLHYHRSEHWTVIAGTGKLTLDDKEVVFKENESTYIPVATKHRLENPGKVPLSIIEVQNGSYLGEDDIVRFDDIYGRTEK